MRLCWKKEWKGRRKKNHQTHFPVCDWVNKAASCEFGLQVVTGESIQSRIFSSLNDVYHSCSMQFRPRALVTSITHPEPNHALALHPSHPAASKPQSLHGWSPFWRMNPLLFGEPKIRPAIIEKQSGVFLFVCFGKVQGTSLTTSWHSIPTGCGLPWNSIPSIAIGSKRWCYTYLSIQHKSCFFKYTNIFLGNRHSFWKLLYDSTYID